MMELSRYPRKSLCPSPKEARYLHDWKILQDTEDGTMELCLRCGSRIRFFHADKAGYLGAHARDALQARGRDADMFIREYGLERFNALNPKIGRQATREEIIAEAKEDLRKHKIAYI